MPFSERTTRPDGVTPFDSILVADGSANADSRTLAGLGEAAADAVVSGLSPLSAGPAEQDVRATAPVKARAKPARNPDRTPGRRGEIRMGVSFLAPAFGKFSIIDPKHDQHTEIKAFGELETLSLHGSDSKLGKHDHEYQAILVLCLMDYQRGSVVSKRTVASAAEVALDRLKQARIPAFDAHREATGQLEYLAGQLDHLTGLAARFERRRNHLLAAAGAPEDSGPAADLAGTAQRMQAGVEQALAAVAESREAVAERQRITAEMVDKIDAAATRLSEALLEQASMARLRALKRGYRERLQTLSTHLPGHGPVAPPPMAAAVAWDLEASLRDATRLTYEAEALTDLQQEHVQ